VIIESRSSPDQSRQIKRLAIGRTFGEGQAGKPVQLLVGDGYNHFEVIETLGNPYGLLGRPILDQMQLART
jgi:arylformamidase